MISLTNEERATFSAYCQQEAMSYDALARQAETLPGGNVFAKHDRMLAAAYAIVAGRLHDVEQVTISAVQQSGQEAGEG